MSTRRLRSAAAALALSCLVGRAARADDNHHQNYLVGERAVGLGGAFTAIADDSSGAYYNPAGLAEVPGSSLSLSAAVYGFAADATAIEGTGVALSGRTFVSYPTTAAWIQRLRRGDEETGAGRMQAAVSLITPHSVVRRRRLAAAGLTGDLAGQSFDYLKVDIAEDDALWIGLSCAWKVHRRVSLGGTLFATVRTGMYQFYELAIHHVGDAATGMETDRRPSAARVDARLLHVGMLGVFGAVVTLTDRLRLGAAVRTPLGALHGRVKINTTAATETDTGGFGMAALDQEASFHDRQPLKVTLGAAYLAPRRYGVSLDVSLYGPQGEYYMISDSGDPELDRGLPMAKRLVPQVNLGGELYLLRTLALRAGLFTNLSTHADCASSETPDRCNEVFADAVDRFSVSGSVGYEIDRATLTLGWSYNYGSASSAVDGMTIRDARAFLMMMLGGSFRF